MVIRNQVHMNGVAHFKINRHKLHTDIEDMHVN